VLGFNHPENFLSGGANKMEKATQQQNTIQDSFLNSARKERNNVTIYLMSGVKLTGRIKSFDKYSLILEAGSQEQLIFKHAISTVSLPRGGGRDFHHARPSSSADREHHGETPSGPQVGSAATPERP
jgi:host factor-I protein